ncbi:AAA family ATPase [Propylenella binzhouense]|uniref:Aminoglycoside phosphotransferase n=1 Tax=Propylenella binzhouense TaxID=2555902 RepID=A0A964T2P4_9HYPH|nr:bifunctional aminoglycoside phosphotransferase/ATP-binding protein [Propylenella binzhouense]MYZ47341.1 aminoglycoside phosphotransferase [Propylenella binzhouense]
MDAADHVVADQSAALAFLADPGTHGTAEPPTRIDTHGAIVFLTERDAYKVKRAVRFPFMDYSTLAKRQAACEAEVAVNAANAPTLYRGVLAITRNGRGLALGGSGEPVEWLVHMARFDERQTLDHVAERGGLTPSLIGRLVEAILASHQRAPLRDGRGASESLRLYLRQNAAAYAEFPDLFPPARAGALTARADAELDALWPLLLERGRAGFVRRCHGDLHLRNIVLLDGEPTLFDAIEFDDAIATGDVLYDLAFLLMDLWERGLKAEANLVLNRYLWAGPDAQLPGLAALPTLLSIRAGIRAKVLAAAIAHQPDAERGRMEAEARRGFEAASAFLNPGPPRLVAVGGLSGSGKSTLAAALAPRLGRAPGAIHLRSDIERKRLAGVAETDRLPPESYTPDAAARVYASLLGKARTCLRAGQSVVLDAVYAAAEERRDAERLAAELGLAFDGLWLSAPEAVLAQRVGSRVGDASDADAAVVRRQAAYDLGAMNWTEIDGTGPLAAVTAAAARRLEAAAAG